MQDQAHVSSTDPVERSYSSGRLPTVACVKLDLIRFNSMRIPPFWPPPSFADAGLVCLFLHSEKGTFLASGSPGPATAAVAMSDPT